LQQYGSLAEVVAHADEIGGVVGANLRAALDWLPTGRQLLTVKIDCALPMGASDLLIAAPDIPTLRTMFERFGFKSWLREGAASAVGDERRDAAPDAMTKIARRGERDTERFFADRQTPDATAIPAVPKDYETIVDADALARWYDAIVATDLVCFDTETTNLNPMAAQIVGLSFAIEPGRACYIPLTHRYAGAPDQLPIADVLARFAPWFADASRAKLGQNVKYDQHVLANHGLALAGVAYDTLLESYVLESHKPHDMDDLAWRHLNVKTTTYDEVTGKGANRIGFDQVSVENATAYSAEDADVALQLHRTLYSRIVAEPKLDALYRDIEIPVREVLFRMERNGVLIDTALLAAQSRELGERVLTLEQQAYATAGQPFNLASPRQLGEILFEKMKLPVVKKTATGQPLHRRGRAAGARRQLSAAEADPRAPRARQAQVDVHRQAAAERRPAHRPRAHDVLASDRRHRPPRVRRSEPAEHSGAHAGRPAHSRGVHRAAGARAGVGRLLADRAADHGPPVGRCGAAEGFSGRRGHPSRDRRGNFQRACE
jgi:DNA polymerase-1